MRIVDKIRFQSPLLPASRMDGLISLLLSTRVLNSVVHAWIETFLGDISIYQATITTCDRLPFQSGYPRNCGHGRRYRFVRGKFKFKFVFLDVKLRGREIRRKYYSLKLSNLIHRFLA